MTTRMTTSDTSVAVGIPKINSADNVGVTHSAWEAQDSPASCSSNTMAYYPTFSELADRIDAWMDRWESHETTPVDGVATKAPAKPDVTIDENKATGDASGTNQHYSDCSRSSSPVKRDNDMAIFGCKDTESTKKAALVFRTKIQDSLRTLEDAYRVFGTNRVITSFNGGKEATLTLYLMGIAAFRERKRKQRVDDAKNSGVQVSYGSAPQRAPGHESSSSSDEAPLSSRSSKAKSVLKGKKRTSVRQSPPTGSMRHTQPPQSEDALGNSIASSATEPRHGDTVVVNGNANGTSVVSGNANRTIVVSGNANTETSIKAISEKSAPAAAITLKKAASASTLEKADPSTSASGAVSATPSAAASADQTASASTSPGETVMFNNLIKDTGQNSSPDLDIRARSSKDAKRKKKRREEIKDRVESVYFYHKDEFPEVLGFMDQVERSLDFHIDKFDCSWEVGIAEKVKDNLCCFVMGTRRSDPNAGSHPEKFEPSSSWIKSCSFMRCNPVLDWEFSDVWRFFRLFDVPFCSLYANGYTSLGTTKDTERNPDLWDAETERWLPAWDLKDGSRERAGRINKKYS